MNHIYTKKGGLCKKVNLLLALAAVGLSGCGPRYNTEEPKTEQDTIAFVLNSFPDNFGLAFTTDQKESFATCTDPLVEGIYKEMSEADQKKIDPEKSQASIEEALLTIAKYVLVNKEVTQCMRDSGASESRIEQINAQGMLLQMTGAAS